MTGTPGGPPAMPIVGDITLTAVQDIVHALDAGFTSSPVPGLDGDPVMRSGRGSHALRIRGVLRGEEAADQLAALQAAAADGAALPFAADITTALELEQVVITDLRAQVVAGHESLVTYELHLVESPPLPPPAEVGGFGGLDDFGLGGLGFDTDLVDDLAGLADDVAGAIDAVSEAVDALQALGALGAIDVSGPLRPLGEAIAGVTAAAAHAPAIASAVAGLLGDGP